MVFSASDLEWNCSDGADGSRVRLLYEKLESKEEKKFSDDSD